MTASARRETRNKKAVLPWRTYLFRAPPTGSRAPQHSQDSHSGPRMPGFRCSEAPANDGGNGQKQKRDKSVRSAAKQLKLNSCGLRGTLRSCDV